VTKTDKQQEITNMTQIGMSAAGAIGVRARHPAEQATKNALVMPHGRTMARNKELVLTPPKNLTPATLNLVQLIACLAIGKTGAGAPSNVVVAIKLELVK